MIFNTPINKLSYGYVGFNILKSLSKLTKVDLFPIGNIECEETEENISLLRHCMENGLLWNKDSPSIRLMHQHKLAEHPISSMKVGFPIFELDSLNKIERHNVSSQDLLFVCSDWARQITNDLVPTSVVPLGVDTNVFKPSPLSYNRGKVVFLNIGKWELRKGHDILLRAFYNVFSDVNDVELWMIPKNRFINPEIEKKWISDYKNALGNKIIFINSVNSHSDIADIINKADVGVFPYRAEGWNMPLTEMLACGKRVIATNYSAPTEYLTPECSTMIDPDGLEMAFDGVFFNGEGRWAELGDRYYRAFCEALRAEYELIKKNGKQFNANGVEQMSKFTWDKTADRIIDILG